MIKVLCVSFFLFLISAKVLAVGLFIEPMYGQEVLGFFSQDINSSATGKYEIKGKTSGSALAGRFGFVLGPLILGAQYVSSSGKTKEVNMQVSSGPLMGIDIPIGSFTYKRKRVGGYLGLRVKKHVKLWASYTPEVEFDLTQTDTVPNETTTYTGKNISFGISLLPVNFISLNIEYMNVKYSKENGKGYPFEEVLSGDTYRVEPLSENVIMISLSLPIEISLFGKSRRGSSGPGPDTSPK